MGEIMDPQKEIINRLQTYIEDHLDKPITFLMLSGEANYSPWYVDKLFKKHLNKTPMNISKKGD